MIYLARCSFLIFVKSEKLASCEPACIKITSFALMEVGRMHDGMMVVVTDEKPPCKKACTWWYQMSVLHGIFACSMRG